MMEAFPDSVSEFHRCVYRYDPGHTCPTYWTASASAECGTLWVENFE